MDVFWGVESFFICHIAIMFDEETMRFAKVIWEYHHMHHELKKADILLVLGSHDLRVPEYAAKLFVNSFASVVIVSGGIAHHNDLLKASWQGTEAEKFAEVLANNGVPTESILLEKEAKNTGENFSLSRAVLDRAGIEFHSVIAITKPYMERRAFATGSKQWPDKEITVSSPPISFEEYFGAYANQETSPEDILNIMMGDLQRIDMYGKNGFQIPQEIPGEVWNAFAELKSRGFTKHLLPES